MAVYYKPQSPIQSGEDFIYPITTADQIMKSDKTRRLEQAGLIVADNSTKLGGKAPEYYIQPRNLLDNSDFRNPVNQRGRTTYNENGYTIDRWENEGTPDLNIVSGGIHLTCNSTLHLFIQRLSDEAWNTLKGKAFTVAVCTDDGSIYVSTGTFPEGTGTLDSYQTGLGSSGYMVNLYKSDNDRPMVRIFSVNQGSKVTLRWAALYEGSYTADNVPPPFFYPQRLEMLNLGLPVQPRNLFDNSDFRNPVNQRGNGDVNTQGDYPIDRWMFDKNGSGCSAGYDANYKYLYIVNNATDGSWGSLYHNVPSEKLNAGTYTICFHEKLIGPISMLAIADDTVTVLESAMYEPDENGLIIAQFTISSRPSNKLLIAVYATQGITVAFDWAALYEGSYTAETLPPYVPKGYAAELAACNVADTGCTDRTLINENTTSIVTGFPQKPTSASKTVFTTPADGNFYLFATRGETAGYTLRIYILDQNDGAVAQFNYPAYYAYAVIGVMIPVKRGMKIMVNTDNSVETWTIHEQKFYY